MLLQNQDSRFKQTLGQFIQPHKATLNNPQFYIQQMKSKHVCLMLQARNGHESKHKPTRGWSQILPPGAHRHEY
jgi:hypothetical protein